MLPPEGTDGGFDGLNIWLIEKKKRGDTFLCFQAAMHSMSAL